MRGPVLQAFDWIVAPKCILTNSCRPVPCNDENIKVVAANLLRIRTSRPWFEETPKSLLVGESGCRLPDHARRIFGRASDVALVHVFRDRNPAGSISASASAHGCRVARSANWDSHGVVATNLIHPRASSWGSAHKNERANCQENDVSIPSFQLARPRLDDIRPLAHEQMQAIAHHRKGHDINPKSKTPRPETPGDPE